MSDLSDAIRLAGQIKSKAEALLELLAREMQIHEWDADYQAIMWEAVAMEAQLRWQRAKLA